MADYPERDAHKRSAKRVLTALIGDDPEREARCWTEANLETLRERGERSGLTGYLDEIRDRIVPLFSATPGR
jgi:hypothetical protein